MNSEIRLFEMTKKDMRHLTKCSFVALFFAALLSCLATALLHIYSKRQINTTEPSVPTGFVLAEITVQMFITFLSLSAIYSHLTKCLTTEDRHKHYNRFVLLLLIASLTFALPFRGFAEVIRGGNGIPNRVFLMCCDVATAVGSCLLFVFFLTYPLIWDESPEGTIHQYKAFMSVLYAALRIALSFSFRIHFEPLPMQHLFSLSGLFARDKSIDLELAPFSCILAISAVECILIFRVYWNYLSRSTALYNANDPSKQQSIVALWYYSKAVVFFIAGALVTAIARTTSPSAQTANLFRKTSVIILSSPIGNSAISLVVLSYTLREVYAHSLLEENDFPVTLFTFFWYRSSRLQRKIPIEADTDLLYRIADERDPQNEDPIPQANNFSFESAILLFNTAWLATTYATKGMIPLTPSDFGRPMCAVKTVISDSNNEVVVIVLERMDRLILAFKPVPPVMERRDTLQRLSKTHFGVSLSDFKDQELLPLKGMNVSAQKLLRQCKLHRGFSEGYSSIQTTLHDYIRDLTLHTSRPLYVTGFGSGGALATICAFDLSLRRVSDTNTISLYSYGASRALNSDMATLFETIVPCRWRCVVAGDRNTVKPPGSVYRHVSKVATFTRSGHLALEFHRVYKWWQSEVSAFPMHKISAYYCAFAKWHEEYHVKGAIDLWDWQIDKTVATLFCHDATPKDFMCTADFLLESPTTDVEAKSLRTLGESSSWPSAPFDEVVAFKR